MPEDPLPDSPESSSSPSFWQELKRRHVVRVAIVYSVVAWLIIQIAAATFGGFGIPDWAFRFVVLMVLLGFPVSLVIAWAFELTPQGIKPTKAAPKETGDAKVHSAKKRWLSVIFAAAVPTLIFGTLAIYFYATRSVDSPTHVSSGQNGSEQATSHQNAASSIQAEQTNDSIAVMPLVNMSSNEENAYFAGGVHEDLLTYLSRIEGLEVISRTTMLRYAASEMTLPEIGNALNVHYIVEGSVRRIGNHVRVTVQLIDARNDHHLWANNYERELVDVFATQSEVAKEISDSLHLEIQPDTVGKLENMPTSSVRAYDLFIKSVSIEKSEGETVDAVTRRRAMLEEAVKEDPDFVEVWGHLKRLYDLMRNRVESQGLYLADGVDPVALVNELKEKSQRALTKAIALDPDNAETLLAQAVDHVWPQPMTIMDQRRKILDRVIEDHPDNGMAWYLLGWWYAKLPEPDHEASINAFEEALKRDPFNARFVRAALTIYRRSNDYENTQRLRDQMLQILPESNYKNLYRLDQIERAFLDSTDMAYIDDFVKVYEALGDTSSMTKYQVELDVMVLTNDQDRILEMAENITMVDTGGDFTLLAIYDIKYSALCVHWLRGDLEKAENVAKEIVAPEMDPERYGLSVRRERIASVRAAAHMVLGHEDRAKGYMEMVLENENESSNFLSYSMIRCLMWVDLDQAVETALSHFEEHSECTVMNRMAAYQIVSRPLLTHPRIQDYYVKEGKWIDYLAERVPEYAKYAENN